MHHVYARVVTVARPTMAFKSTLAAASQHRQLRLRQRYRAAAGLLPDEAAALPMNAMRGE